MIVVDEQILQRQHTSECMISSQLYLPDSSRISVLTHRSQIGICMGTGWHSPTRQVLFWLEWQLEAAQTVLIMFKGGGKGI